MNFKTGSTSYASASIRPDRALYFAVYGFLYSFGIWTLLCNLSVALHVRFRSLPRLAVAAFVAGWIVAWIGSGKTVESEEEVQEGTGVAPAPAGDVPLWWLLAAGIIVGLRALPSYGVFWTAAVVFLAAYCKWTFKSGDRVEGSRPSRLTQRGVVLLLGLCAISAGLTYAAHRPDEDDAFFVGVAADAVAHPDLPVMGHDSLYGDTRFPLVLPTYAVDSVELLSASLAWLFGGAPIWWSHAVLPTIFAALLPLSWAWFMRTVTRHWIAAAAVSMALLALLGEAHHSLGNFAYVRLFQGKAVLASVAIPLLFASARRYEVSGRAWDWSALVACTVSALGLSSSALFVVPLALGIAALSSPVTRLSRMAATFAPSLYVIAWGLALRGHFAAVSGVFAGEHPTMRQTVSDVFGAHGQYVIFFGLLAAPLLATSSRCRKSLALVSLLFLLGPLNPVLFPVMSRLTTPEAVWRTLWSIPVAGLAGLLLVELWARIARASSRVGMIAFAAASLALIAALLPYASWRKSNGVTFSREPLKVRRVPWDVARAAMAATPRGRALLAPEEVASWVPTFLERPPLVSVRPNYDDQMGVRMSDQESGERRALREMVSGTEFSARETLDLINVLPRYNVGMVVTTESARRNLQELLAAHHYFPAGEQNGYALFALHSGASGPSTGR